MHRGQKLKNKNNNFRTKQKAELRQMTITAKVIAIFKVLIIA